MSRVSAVALPGKRLAALVFIGTLVALTSSARAGDQPQVAVAPAEDPHAAIFNKDNYPSATQCAPCHGRIYNEWRLSNHAYAFISPMFHKFEQRIIDLAPTIGSFCVRCHGTVGTQLGEKRETPLWERARVSLEGVTCITCHRVNVAYLKENGERNIVPGSVFEPIYGPFDGEGVRGVVKNQSQFPIKTSPTDTSRGTPIHVDAMKFDQLSKPEFCMSCHQVAVNIGIKLEVVWDQYKSSPAYASGVSCQDCHMGKVLGVAKGYDEDYVATLSGQPLVAQKRQHSNHSFIGPGYPIAHPGIFPPNPDAERWTIKQWMAFDYRQWCDKDFQSKVEKKQISVTFPADWSDATDRDEACDVIAENLKLIEKKKELRRQVMENGSRVDGPYFSGTPQAGQTLSFYYNVSNVNPGHNLPSGSLGAQPEVWVDVALTDPDGKRVWESGYVDSIGDMADLHSQDVLHGRLPVDRQLVNLQTKFLTTNIAGTDREMPLPVNEDFDQLPFARPPNVPASVLNHPPFVRMEQRSIPPLGSRTARYTVDGDLLKKAGTYKLSVRLRSRAEPIYFMRFVNATIDMERAMNEWMLDIHPYTVSFEVK
jgi:hypothetical protein